MTPISVSLPSWVAGWDGKLRGFDPTGSEGGGGGGALEYTIDDHPTNVFWVEDGAAGGGDGTYESPYQNTRQALDETTNGQGASIIIKNGTIAVTSANRLDWQFNDRTASSYSAINSGAGWAASHTDRDNMITIRAETPYGVRFQYTGTGGYYYSAVRFDSAEYISVDGFIFEWDETGGGALWYAISLGDNNYMSRCIIKRANDEQDGSWVEVSNNCLVEMCAGVGATRYGFRGGASSGTLTSNVFRMCVGRQDFNDWLQPCATFAHYGSNSGTTATDCAFLNCISLDSQFYATGDSNKIRWGSLYCPKNSKDIQIRGFISLNEESNYAGIFSGEQQGENIETSDCVIWDLNGASSCDGFRINASGAGNTADSLTIGNIIDDFYYSSNSETATNSRANDSLNGTDKTILNQSDGADARYMFGDLGQRYGDSGYATKSTTEIFPWPYEATIKSVFAEQINTASGSTPASNTSNRGFCLDSSLTNYIITYVDGAATIEDVY